MDHNKEPEAKEIFENMGCPMSFAMEILNGKWTLPVLWCLKNKGTVRYNELTRQINGVTNIMLTQTLKSLEQYDIIARIQYNEVPPRVEYSLTENGKALLEATSVVAEWGREQMKKT